MDEKPGKPAQGMKGGTAALAAILVLAPVLYVLSIGPVYALVQRNVISNRIAIVYRPVILAGDRSETACSWLIWYLGLWAPAEHPDPLGPNQPFPSGPRS
jgi:hypothetical protein